LNLISTSARGGRKGFLGLIALAVTMLIVATYWPVLYAQFVWNDIPNFQQSSWIRYGDEWRHLIFHGFNDWTNYFRPLVVALFTLEVRSFDAQPSPMHAVSLFMHVLNTMLVGALAVSLNHARFPQVKRWQLITIPMLLYGLHPLLVESVTWIGCQFDLLATFFVLLALVCNKAFRHRWLRAASMALCFLLGACAKESALVLPLEVLVFDWLALSANHPREIFRRNWPVYALMVAAGITYLFLRHWAMGEFALDSGGDHLSPWARLQVVCFLYIRYWQLFFWPMAGMGPMHPVAMHPFFTFNIGLFFCDLTAIGLALIGLWLTFHRFYLGALITVVTFALMPVLHIAAAYLDTSLYHERYAMIALALACSLLPSTLQELPIPGHSIRTASFAGYISAIVWLGLSVTNIRQTVPLWSSQVPLWQWAVQENPDFIGAKDELISAYIGAGDNAKAWQLINSVIAENVPCASCMLNGANLALRQGNMRLATFFIDRLESTNGLTRAEPTTLLIYFQLKAELLLLQKKPAAAEKVLRMAISIDRTDPDPQVELAAALALQGQTAEANEAIQAALMLIPPQDRAKRHQAFLKLLASTEVNSAKR
jgi:tetratricopeptide (TPR) repeat protein